MKKIILSFFASTLLFYANAQLTKGNWLVGGSGSFLSSKNSYSSSNFNSTSDRIDIMVSPNIGFFFIDKLGVGLRPSFSKYKEEVNGPGGLTSNVSRFEFGPFLKYYFLKIDKSFNLLADLSYQYGLFSSKPTTGNINKFSASAGPVIFFNSSVGLEFLVGYYQRKEVIKQNGDITTNQKGIQVNIGFQIHLEK